jgi:hypothetical protein
MFSEMLCFLALCIVEFLRVDKVIIVILRVIHRLQNPLDSTLTLLHSLRPFWKAAVNETWVALLTARQRTAVRSPTNPFLLPMSCDSGFPIENLPH